MTSEWPPLSEQLRALDQLRDEDIDLSDIPEKLDFSRGERRRYYNLADRGYDVRALANWVIDRASSEGKAVTSMWVNKFVYFVYELALQNYRTLMTPARVEAWDHGPVFREIYFGYESESATKLKRYNPLSGRKEVATEKFNEEDLKILESTWVKYGNLSPSKLRQISHEPGTPWDKIWHDGGRENPGMAIDVATIIGHVGLNYGKRAN